jgi:hypothetical protein
MVTMAAPAACMVGERRVTKNVPEAVLKEAESIGRMLRQHAEGALNHLASLRFVSAPSVYVDEA